MNGSSKQGQLTVLDCTLRDGGYYNDWDFERPVVDAYLQAAAASGIDVIELGFRFRPQKKFLGPYAYTTDRFLDGLTIPATLVLGVMINAKDYLTAPEGPEAALRKNFKPRKDSKISLVRIAAHAGEIINCSSLVQTLTALGYRVGINIMQSNGCANEQLAELAKTVSDFGKVEVLYFADSLGNMDGTQINRVIAALRRGWEGPLGFHGHDNMGKGVSNTLDALEAGITWLDATIAGMGRGAGNTQMEYLLAELHHREWKKVVPAPVIDLACHEFRELKSRYQWGTNIFYYMAAMYGVHPTYVHEMQAQDGFAPNDIAHLIEMLGENGGTSYKTTGVATALMSRFSEENGTWSADALFKNRVALIIAGGESAKRHWPGIENFIREHNPVVITLNRLSFVSPELISAIAVCHPGRLVPFLNGMIVKANLPLVTPFTALPQGLRTSISHLEIWDYGMRIEPALLRASEKGCVIPAPLVAPYVLCAAIAGGANRVYLVGMDGYDGHEPRFHEMNDILVQLQKIFPATPIISLTATHYDVPQQSVYQN